MATIGAIEAGGTKFVLALANEQGAILDRTRIATREPPATFAEMLAWFEAAQERHGSLGAFGIGSFGPLDIDPSSPSWGTFTTTPKPGWSGTSWPDALAGFGVPIALDTDVNAAALGEWLAGAGRNARTLGYTTVGTGIGTGVLANGVALRGVSHYESGHIAVPRVAGDDWPGVCSYHGDCLEGLASGPAVLARWGHDLSHGDAAEVAQIAAYLAHLAATLVLLHMPERLIFGGGVMKSPGLFAALRQATRADLAGYVAAWDRDLTELIVPPALGDDAGITGAIELGRRILVG